VNLTDLIRRALQPPTTGDGRTYTPRMPTVTHIPAAGLTTEPALVIAAARQGDTVPEARDQQIPMPATRRLPPDDRPRPRPQADPLTDSGVHHLDEQLPTITVTVERRITDVLHELRDLIPTDPHGSVTGDTIIRDFYQQLLAAAPDLASLFPADLITATAGQEDSPGALQRDRLLSALVDVLTLYGGGREAMTRLNALITSMGNRHAAFARPDGTVRGATEQEYDAVGSVFTATLVNALGDHWKPEYGVALAEAYRYTKIGMLWAQLNSGMTMPRYPRAAR
jgi:hemoglobin-like flavoprotein